MALEPVEVTAGEAVAIEDALASNAERFYSVDVAIGEHPEHGFVVLIKGTKDGLPIADLYREKR